MAIGLLIIAFILNHPFITILIVLALSAALNPGLLYEEYLACKSSNRQQ